MVLASLAIARLLLSMPQYHACSQLSGRHTEKPLERMVYLLLGQASGPDGKPLVIELIISVDPTIWPHAHNLQVRLTLRIAMVVE